MLDRQRALRGLGSLVKTELTSVCRNLQKSRNEPLGGHDMTNAHAGRAHSPGSTPAMPDNSGSATPPKPPPRILPLRRKAAAKPRDAKESTLAFTAERRAFAAFVEETKSKAYRLACAMVGPQAAWELVQDAYTAFWRNPDREHLKTTPISYLCGIIRHKAYDVYDARARRRALEEELATASPAGLHMAARMPAPDAAVDFGPLGEALSKLDADTRACIVMTVVVGLSYEDVAHALECSEGDVRNWRYRGLAALEKDPALREFAPKGEKKR